MNPKKDIYINEINTIPGSHAVMAKLNISKYELLSDIVDRLI